MSREAMKELVRANKKCTDVVIGRWLYCYEKGDLDKRRRVLFTAHLGECLHCMALYNIETKHKYGYINPKQTRARHIKVTLLERLPHVLAALSIWVVAISVARLQPMTQPADLSPQETSNARKRDSFELRADLLDFSKFVNGNEVATAPKNLVGSTSKQIKPATNQTKESAYVVQISRKEDPLAGKPDDSAVVPSLAAAPPSFNDQRKPRNIPQLTLANAPVDEYTTPPNNASEETEKPANHAGSSEMTALPLERVENKNGQE